MRPGRHAGEWSSELVHGRDGACLRKLGSHSLQPPARPQGLHCLKSIMPTLKLCPFPSGVGLNNAKNEPH